VIRGRPDGLFHSSSGDAVKIFTTHTPTAYEVALLSIVSICRCVCQHLNRLRYHHEIFMRARYGQKLSWIQNGCILMHCSMQVAISHHLCSSLCIAIHWRHVPNKERHYRQSEERLGTITLWHLKWST